MKELLWIIPCLFLIAWKPLTIRNSNDTSAINQNFDRLEYQDSQFVTKSGTQTITGYKTFGDAVNMSTLTVTGQAILSGTDTNDSAAAGNYGEYKSSYVGTWTNFAASNNWTATATLPLTAGDWDVSAMFSYSRNGGDLSLAYFSIGGDAYEGDVAAIVSPTAYYGSESVPSVRVSLNSSANLSAWVYGIYTSGTPQYKCRMSARRVR